MSKNENYKRLINTRRWRTLRLYKLQSHPLCERCEREGLVTLATEVHHIVPVESVLHVNDMARLMYDPHNLMALCGECHRAVHKELKKDSTARHVEEFKRLFDLD